VTGSCGHGNKLSASVTGIAAQLMQMLALLRVVPLHGVSWCFPGETA
jgi:hypothetical protein